MMKTEIGTSESENLFKTPWASVTSLKTANDALPVNLRWDSNNIYMLHTKRPLKDGDLVIEIRERWIFGIQVS